jgi:hypothetical protein
MLYVRTACSCQCCMSLLHLHAVCPGCIPMSMLHVLSYQSFLAAPRAVLPWQSCIGTARSLQSFPGIPVLAVLFCQSSSACPFLPVLFCLAFSACPFLPVLFCLSCSACPVLSILFCLSCSACPVLPILFYLSCTTCPACPVMNALFSLPPFCLSSFDRPVLLVHFSLSCLPILSACPVCLSCLPVLFYLSYSVCPFLPVPFCLSLSACPVLPVLFLLFCSASPASLPIMFFVHCSVCPVLYVHFVSPVLPVHEREESWERGCTSPKFKTQKEQKSASETKQKRVHISPFKATNAFPDGTPSYRRRCQP